MRPSSASPRAKRVGALLVWSVRISKFGRKPKLTPEQIVLALRLVDEGQSVPQVAETFGVHETTIYRCLSAAEAAA